MKNLFLFGNLIAAVFFAPGINQAQAQTPSVPVLSSPTISNLTTTSATLGATVTSLGFPASISERGTCYGTTASPTTNCVATSGTTTGAYSHAQAGLTPGTSYFFRGYARNSTGTGYSPDGTFSTAVSSPTVTTPTVSNIFTTSATLGANVTSLGLPAAISERGTCYGTTANPTTNCIAEGGTTGGTFTQSRTGLTPGTVYFFRGYAINMAGTSYSADGTFTTTALPTLSTPTVSAITPTSATLGATVTSLGLPLSISARGTCFGTVANPTTNCIAASGTTAGEFSQARTGLTPGTLYYYRGYATNATGTGYSPDGTFTTVSNIPTLANPTASSITGTSAVLGAEVLSLGVIEGFPSSISARGTCYGATPNPTTNCTIQGGTLTGTYSHTRTGLTPGTLYYYRGYATNTAGTGYSLDGTFTTANLPIVTNPIATDVAATSATLGATVTSLGFPASISARGTCYGTTANPTTNCVAAADTTTGAYLQPRTGLTPGTAYFYRGYVTNATGTGYSADGTFTTTIAAPTALNPIITNPTSTSINTTSVTLGANVTSLGLPASISARGTCLGTLPAPTTNCVAASGTTTGVFSQTRTGLNPGTYYYYRGYARNATGIGYSSDGTFATVGSIRVTASSISGDGLYAITVFVSNDNPKSLRLKVEYGEGNFGLKSNTFSFDDAGRGVASFTGLRPAQTYQYRLFDTTGVLRPSDTYAFTTSPGSSVYQSYLVSYAPSGSGGTSSLSTVSTTPIPVTPPAGNGALTTSPSTTSTPIVLGGSTPGTSGTTPSSTTTSTPPSSSGGLVACDNTPAPDGTIANPCGFPAFMNLINTVIKFILFFMVVPIAAIMFAYAGFELVTSGGSTEKRGVAKKVFTNAVIGLVIAVAAWLIVRTILVTLGYKDIGLFF